MPPRALQLIHASIVRTSTSSHASCVALASRALRRFPKHAVLTCADDTRPPGWDGCDDESNAAEAARLAEAADKALPLECVPDLAAALAILAFLASDTASPGGGGGITAQNVALWVLPRLGCALPATLPSPPPPAGSPPPPPSFPLCLFDFARSSPDARTAWVGGVWRTLRAVSPRGPDFSPPAAALLSCLASCASVVADEVSQLADASSPLWKAVAPPAPPPAVPQPKRAPTLRAPAVTFGSLELPAVATEVASDYAALIEERRMRAETAADAAARLLHTLLALVMVAIDQGVGAGDVRFVADVLTRCAVLPRAPSPSRLVSPGADVSHLAVAYEAATPLPSFSLLELRARPDSPLGCEAASLLRKAALRLATTAAQRAGGIVAADVWRALVRLLALDDALPAGATSAPPPPPDHLVEGEAARVAASRLAAGGDTWGGLAGAGGPLSLDRAAQQQQPHHHHRLLSRARVLACVVAAAVAAAPPRRGAVAAPPLSPAPPRDVLASLPRVLTRLCASRYTPSNFRDARAIADALAAARHSDARGALGHSRTVPSYCARQVGAVKALAADIAALVDAHLGDAAEAAAAADAAEAAAERAEREEKRRGEAFAACFDDEAADEAALGAAFEAAKAAAGGARAAAGAARRAAAEAAAAAAIAAAAAAAEAAALSQELREAVDASRRPPQPPQQHALALAPATQPPAAAGATAGATHRPPPPPPPPPHPRPPSQLEAAVAAAARAQADACLAASAKPLLLDIPRVCVAIASLAAAPPPPPPQPSAAAVVVALAKRVRDAVNARLSHTAAPLSGQRQQQQQQQQPQQLPAGSAAAARGAAASGSQRGGGGGARGAGARAAQFAERERAAARAEEGVLLASCVSDVLAVLHAQSPAILGPAAVETWLACAKWRAALACGEEDRALREAAEGGMASPGGARRAASLIKALLLATSASRGATAAMPPPPPGGGGAGADPFAAADALRCLADAFFRACLRPWERQAAARAAAEAAASSAAAAGAADGVTSPQSCRRAALLLRVADSAGQRADEALVSAHAAGCRHAGAVRALAPSLASFFAPQQPPASPHPALRAAVYAFAAWLAAEEGCFAAEAEGSSPADARIRAFLVQRALSDAAACVGDALDDLWRGARGGAQGDTVVPRVPPPPDGATAWADAPPPAAPPPVLSEADAAFAASDSGGCGVSVGVGGDALLSFVGKCFLQPPPRPTCRAATTDAAVAGLRLVAAAAEAEAHRAACAPSLHAIALPFAALSLRAPSAAAAARLAPASDGGCGTALARLVAEFEPLRLLLPGWAPPAWLRAALADEVAAAATQQVAPAP